MPYRNLPVSLHRFARWALVTGLLISCTLFAWIYQLEQQNEHAKFERRAQARSESIEQGLNAAVDALKVVNQLFVTTDNNVTREQFRSFTQPLLERYPYIEGLTFARMVSNAQRPAFEAQMQRRYPGFRISEIVDGRRIVARIKESYRVIDYVEPERRNELVFGLDGSSVSFLEGAIHQSRDIGHPVATELLPLFNRPGKVLGFRIFMPVYRDGVMPDEIRLRREAVTGYTVMVLRAHDLFDKVLQLAQGSLGNADLDISVYAADSADESQLAYRSASQWQGDHTGSRQPSWLTHRPQPFFNTFIAAGRPWHIVIDAQPTPFLATHTSAVFALLLGLLTTAGIAAYLHSAALRGRQVVELVEVRTEELRQLNERLQGDIKVREQVQQALAVSEERARDMADMSSDWYWEQNEHLRFINFSTDVMGEDGLPSTIELPPGVLGATRWELPVDLGASDWAAHQAQLQAHQPFKEFEYRMALKGIPVEWISASGKPIFDAQGEFKGYRGTARDITARKRAEEALRQSRADLRRLADHLNQVKEDERKRIARDIHDELGQNLLALRMDVVMVEKDAHSPAFTKERVAAILNHIDDTIQSVRAIINDLRPGVLDLGLHAAVEWQAEQFERRTGITCAVHIDHDEFALDDARATALFRIVQEALTNIQRHANATHVTIEMIRSGAGLEIKITDNGIGLPAECRRKANSFGLVGIEERVRMLGGALTITSNQGQGTALLLCVPV